MKRAISLILAVIMCVSLFAMPVSADAVPKNMTVTAENVELTGKIELTWTESTSPDAFRYYIQRADSAGGPFTSIGDTRFSSFTDKTAVAGHSYYYSVTAEDNMHNAVDSSNVISHTCRCARIVNAQVDYNDDGKAIMTWDTIEGATSYRIMRAPAKLNKDGTYALDGQFSVLATPTTPTYTDTSAIAGKYYWYQIYAVSSLSADADSSPFVGCMFPLYPKPQDLTVTSTAKGNEISWSKVKDLSGYTILIGKSADMDDMEPMLEANGDPVLILQPLLKKTCSYTAPCVHDVYYCIVGMAYNAKDENIIPATPTYVYVPHQYKSVVTAPTCTEKGYVTYTCDCGDSYKEEIAPSGHNYVSSVVKPTCTKQGYTLHKCSCGDSYKDNYTDALGHSYKSGVCERCGAKAAKPGTPSVSITTVASTGKIKLSWAKVTGASKYEVYRSTDNKTFKKLTTTTSTSCTNTSATAGTKYYYKVRAISAEGAVGSYSKVVSKICDLAQPVVTLSNVASSGKIKVSWAKVTGASKYEVYRATSSSGTYKKLTSTTSTSYTDTSAKAGSKYYYKVKAICSKTSDANSAYSAVKNLTCDLARPTAKITTSSGHPKVTWAKVTSATKYEVYRATSKSGTYTKLTTTTSTSYTDKKAKAGKTYYYKVKAVCKTSAAASAYSSIVSIKAK